MKVGWYMKYVLPLTTMLHDLFGVGLEARENKYGPMSKKLQSKKPRKRPHAKKNPWKKTSRQKNPKKTSPKNSKMKQLSNKKKDELQTEQQLKRAIIIIRFTVLQK